MQIIEKPKHGSEEWLRLRWRDEKGNVLFGASDAPALMGASPYTSRSELFVNKLSKPEIKPDNPAFRRGNLLEPVLLGEASEFLGKPIFTPQQMYRQNRFIVSLDGVDNAVTPSVIVEAKTTNKYAIRSSNDLPEEWLWQGWAQQMVLQVPVWFVVLDRDLRFSVVEMPTNETAIDSLVTEAEIFAEMVESGKPSPSDLNTFSADQIARIYEVQPTAVEIGDEGMEWVFQLESARSAKKIADEQEAQARDEIAKMLLGNEVALYNGEKVLSWKQQEGRAGFDAAKFKAENPELATRYEKQGQPYRVMRTHQSKEKK
jgi:predicted phage-related endonuclease